jgi:hypothetical protein
MTLITCKDCKKEFSSDAKRCPHCGANKKRSNLTLKVLLGLVGLGLVQGLLLTPSGTTPVATPITAQAQPLSPPTKEVAGQIISQAQALIKRAHDDDALGKKMLAQPNKTPKFNGPMITKAEWANMRERLASIKEPPELVTKATNLLAEMDAHDKASAAFMKTMVSRGRVDARKDFAANLEQRMVDQRMNVDVTASGERNTVLTIKWILANKVTTNDLQKTTIVDDAEKAGFKKVKFTNGYDYGVAWTLNPKAD